MINKLSIIVLSYNKARMVSSLLSSIVRQDVNADDYEVVISDDGSNDATGETVHSFQKTHKNIRFITNPRAGVGHSRNKGLEAASCNLILFLADDYVIPNDLINNILLFFNKYNCDILKLGLEMLYGSGFLQDTHSLFGSYTADYMIKLSRAKEIDRFNGKKVFNINNFVDSTRCVFKREVFNKAGGYVSCERGEDAEFAHRIRDMGFKIYYYPALGITHNHPYYWKTFLRHNFEKGKFILAFNNKNKSRDISLTRKLNHYLWKTRDWFRFIKKTPYCSKNNILAIAYVFFFLFISIAINLGVIFYEKRARI